jgi:branched-chain amino acid transport system permease protein
MATTQERVSLLPLLQEGMPDAQGWMRRRIVMAALGVVVLVTPSMVGSTYAKYISFGIIYAIVGLSLNVLMGYAGQVSLGHHAFVGVGAFTSAYAVSHLSHTTGDTIPFTTFMMGVLIAMATGAAAAIALGFVALRLKGLYLALITLAYGLIAQNVIFGLEFLGGAAGATAPRPTGFSCAGLNISAERFDCQKSYTYLCYVFLAIVLFIDWRLVKSKAGRAIFAIRENEIAAASFGINVVAYKLLAFVISGAFAGLAGSLYAHWTTSVNAGSFDFQLALTFVLMVAVGGLESRAGIVLSSMFFAIFPLIATNLAVYVTIIGALLLLFTLATFPGGLGQQLRPLTEWLRGKPFSIKHDEGGVASGGAGVRP